MVKQTQEQERELGLVYTPERGLNGLVEDTKRKYRLLGVKMPLQISFIAPNIEIYTGVTYWQDISGGSICVPITHSSRFGIERIGTITRNNRELAEKLFEKSKALFKRFPSLEVDYREDMYQYEYEGKDIIGKWRTYNGYSVYASKDKNGNFELCLGDRCTIKEEVPKVIIEDFDTLISDLIGNIIFERVKGPRRFPRYEGDGRYYVRHPSWIHGG